MYRHIIDTLTVSIFLFLTVHLTPSSIEPLTSSHVVLSSQQNVRMDATVFPPSSTALRLRMFNTNEWRLLCMICIVRKHRGSRIRSMRNARAPRLGALLIPLWATLKKWQNTGVNIIIHIFFTNEKVDKLTRTDSELKGNNLG